MIITIEFNIGIPELRQQKQWLLHHICQASADVEEAEGLLNLLDAIQDHLVDRCGVPETEFTYSGDRLKGST